MRETIRAYQALATWQLTHPGDDFESDSDRNDDIENPLVQAPKSIDQDDEEGIINWFAGWSMMKLDTYRMFPVIGTNSGKAPQATRIKEVRAHKASNSLPSPAELQKQEAQEITAKLDEAGPKEAPSTTELSQDLTSPVSIRSPIDARQSQDVLTFIVPTGCGPKVAPRLLAKANGDLIHREEEFDAQVADTKSNRPQAQKIASNSRAGIVTTDKGNRSVLRSVGPNNTVPPEHLAGPDFVPENDIGFYTNSHAVDVVTRYEIGADASASRVSLKDISCRASLAISPGEMSMSSCEDGSWALGGGQEPQPQPDTEMDSEKTNTEELEMMTERIAESFKATSAWYRKLQAKEIKWQHVTVITQ
ncbi:hypothetical protein ACEPPN_015244 [Leptodophora sp. 'Broadleaf-Isolate-01']